MNSIIDEFYEKTFVDEVIIINMFSDKMLNQIQLKHRYVQNTY